MDANSLVVVSGFKLTTLVWRESRNLNAHWQTSPLPALCLLSFHVGASHVSTKPIVTKSHCFKSNVPYASGTQRALHFSESPESAHLAVLSRARNGFCASGQVQLRPAWRPSRHMNCSPAERMTALGKLADPAEEEMTLTFAADASWRLSQDGRFQWQGGDNSSWPPVLNSGTPQFFGLICAHATVFGFRKNHRHGAVLRIVHSMGSGIPFCRRKLNLSQYPL